MKQSIHVIYIPGFGDEYDSFRKWVLKLWRYDDLTIELVPMRWRRGTFAEKVTAIDKAIERAKGKRIVLLGESAGGSMVVHSYAKHSGDIYKAMTICGKNSHPETVGQRYYDNYPSFKLSMKELNESISLLLADEMAKFTSIRPIYDAVVPVRETLLPGCRQVKLWSIGHLFTIFLALTIYSPVLIREIRR